MKITLKNNHKILKDSETINLPNFTILTGENGSGKTQLLEWIYSDFFGGTYDISGDSFEKKYVLNDSGTPYKSTILINPGLVAPFEQQHQKDTLFQTIKNQWDTYEYVARSYVFNTKITLDNISLEINKLNAETGKFHSKGSFENHNSNRQYRPIYEHELEEILKLAQKANKNPERLDFIDFLIFYEIPTNLFAPNIELLFHQFELKKKYYPELTKGVKDPVLLFNEITSSANFKYEAQPIELVNDDIPTQLVLLDTQNGNKVNIENLSSGEKTILSLIFTLYSSRASFSFPDLILFDEPDAFLHPSMTKLFLDVVREVIVKENKVDVIMTTHSPSTVALAPEDSLFIMRRDIGYPTKINSSEAISSLVYGLNGLFVSRENRRQIFVESEYDERFYEFIYNKIKKNLRNDIQLIFIASGKTKIASSGAKIGTREQVEFITKIMRDSDNKQIWGIVDWDNQKTKHPYVVNIGDGKRYTIENYILDPLLIGILLIKDGLISPSEMELNHDNYASIIVNQTNEDLQTITNWVLKKLDLFTSDSNELSFETLANGMKIKLPNKFLEMSGHDYEGILTKKIHKLGAVTSSQNNDRPIKLKMAILERVLTDLPLLISNDFITTFRYIQETR